MMLGEALAQLLSDERTAGAIEAEVLADDSVATRLGGLSEHEVPLFALYQVMRWPPGRLYWETFVRLLEESLRSHPGDVTPGQIQELMNVVHAERENVLRDPQRFCNLGHLVSFAWSSVHPKALSKHHRTPVWLAKLATCSISQLASLSAEQGESEHPPEAWIARVSEALTAELVATESRDTTLLSDLEHFETPWSHASGWTLDGLRFVVLRYWGGPTRANPLSGRELAELLMDMGFSGQAKTITKANIETVLTRVRSDVENAQDNVRVKLVDIKRYRKTGRVLDELGGS